MIQIVKSIFPIKLRKKLRRIWHLVKPPRVILTEFVNPGCQFEITCSMERARVENLGHEMEFLRHFFNSLQFDDVFFDIGSCVGLYAIHASLLGSQVVAFEPDPSYRKRLHRNIKINNQQNKIRVIDWAVSDHDGYAYLYTNGVNGISPSLNLVGKREKVWVKTRSIDNAIFDKSIPSPTIIKLDIEGAEILALKGMDHILKSDFAPRLIYIELHPQILPKFGSSVEECVNFVKSRNYVNLQISERANEIHYIFTKN